MKTNLVLKPVDIAVLLVIGVLLILASRTIAGFFHEGKRKRGIRNSYSGVGPVKMTLDVSGMMCGQCEAHVNDVIRKNFKVDKVTSSHTKGRTVIIAGHDIREDQLRDALQTIGYELQGIRRENYG